jgi:hypothetical protein
MDDLRLAAPQGPQAARREYSAVWSDPPWRSEIALR